MIEELVDAARQTGIVTHAHEIGIEGAVLVASATEQAARVCSSREILKSAAERCSLDEFKSRLAIAHEWLDSPNLVASARVKQTLGNGIAARQSCATAIDLALRFREQPFLEMQQFIVEVGGDVDTTSLYSAGICSRIFLMHERASGARLLRP